MKNSKTGNKTVSLSFALWASCLDRVGEGGDGLVHLPPLHQLADGGRVVVGLVAHQVGGPRVSRVCPW